MDGIRWNCDMAEITEFGSFQAEDGEPMAYAKFTTWGGKISLSVSPDDLSKLAPHKGKRVSISGRLDYEIKKSGKEAVKFYVGEVVPHK